MSITRSGRFCLILTVLLAGSLQAASHPGAARATGATVFRVTRVMALRARSESLRASSSLKLICTPDPCAGNSTGPTTNGIVIGHGFTPDALRAGALGARVADAQPARGSATSTSAVPASSTPTETISITGASWLATATFDVSLQTPPVTESNTTAPAPGPVGTTAPDGTIVFSNVPIVIGPTYIVTVTAQSPKRNAVAYFHLKLPAKRLH